MRHLPRSLCLGTCIHHPAWGWIAQLDSKDMPGLLYLAAIQALSNAWQQKHAGKTDFQVLRPSMHQVDGAITALAANTLKPQPRLRSALTCGVMRGHVNIACACCSAMGMQPSRAHQVDGAIAGAAAHALQLQPRLYHIQWRRQRCSYASSSAACSV
jgi:hypothetical protein